MAFNAEQCLIDCGVVFKKVQTDYKGKACIKFELKHCLFDSSHINNDACLFQYESGGVFYKCFHNSCQGFTWEDAKKKLKSEYNLNLAKYWPDSNLGLQNNFSPQTITADFNPAMIPTRDWVVLHSLLRGHVSVVVGPGSVGKSVYVLTESILIAGRGPMSVNDLVGPVIYRANTLLINNEDDQSELERRIAGIMLEYDINPQALDGCFFYESGYGAKRLIADETLDEGVVKAPFVESLVAYIREKEVAVIAIEPFVSTHRSSENDNSKIDDIIQIYKEIAASTGCAIRLVHHTRKGAGNDGPTIEDSRGGKALSDGCRIGETLLPLPANDKSHFGISDDDAQSIIRMDSAKVNYSKKGSGIYFQLKSIQIQNGDWVGVPRRIELEVKSKNKENKVPGIASTMAECVTDKIGFDGGALPWSELKSSYMNRSDVKNSIASQHVTLLPKGRKKAQKVGIPNDIKSMSYFYVWYEKADGKTSPIIVHVEPQKTEQEEVNDALF